MESARTAIKRLLGSTTGVPAMQQIERMLALYEKRYEEPFVPYALPEGTQPSRHRKKRKLCNL